MPNPCSCPPVVHVRVHGAQALSSGGSGCWPLGDILPSPEGVEDTIQLKCVITVTDPGGLTVVIQPGNVHTGIKLKYATDTSKMQSNFTQTGIRGQRLRAGYD